MLLIFYVFLASSLAGLIPRKIVHSKEMPNKPMIHLEIETFFDHNRKQSVMFKTLILRQCGFEQARYATIRQV